MSNSFKKDFRKMKSLNVDNNIIPFILDKPNKLKKISSIIITPLLKRKLHMDSSLESDINKQKSINENKNSLFLKKINLKEKKNKYYIEGIHKLFNDESIFLDNYYKGKKIIVGKSRKKSNVDLNTRNCSKNNIKKIKQKSKNVSSNNITLNKSLLYQINNNTLFNDSLMQSTKGKKLVWIAGKKKDNFISDDELTKLYQECIKRENRTIKKIMNIPKNKNIINNENKSPSVKECNNILHLQSLVLNKYKSRNMERKKIIDRLLKLTSKKKGNLLINQLNDYRIKKEKKDEEEINNIINNPKFKKNNIRGVDTKLQWITSLRDYQDNEKINNKNNNRCFSSNNKDLSSTHKFYTSFDKKDVLFDLTGKINPLFAQITPKIYRENEKIRETLNDFKNSENNSLYNNKIKMNSSLYNNKISKLHLYKGLNIKGKKLINIEIELSKDLEGKKKRIVQYPYKEDEISTKLFAKSYSVNNFFVPKSVKNTIDLHYNQE